MDSKRVFPCCSIPQTATSRIRPVNSHARKGSIRKGEIEKSIRDRSAEMSAEKSILASAQVIISSCGVIV